MVLLDYKAVLFLIFWGISIIIFIVIPTNSHFHPQFNRVPFYLQSCRHLLSLIFLVTAILTAGSVRRYFIMHEVIFHYVIDFHFPSDYLLLLSNNKKIQVTGKTFVKEFIPKCLLFFKELTVSFISTLIFVISFILLISGLVSLSSSSLQYKLNLLIWGFALFLM